MAKEDAKSLRTCKKGHQYYKSSDCPTCPICENERKPIEGFLSSLAAPARRALESAGLITPQLVSSKTEKELLALHGFGKTSIPTLKKALKEAGLELKK